MRMPEPRHLLVASIVLAAVFVAAVLLLPEHHAAAPAPPTTTAPPPQPPTPTVAARAFSATLTWQTAAPTQPLVRWGPKGMEPLLWTQEAAPTTEHEVRLTGLAPNTTYVATADDRRFELTTLPVPTVPAAEVHAGVLHVDGDPVFPVLAWQECPDRWPQDLRAGITLLAGNPCTGLPNLLAAVAGRALVAGTADDTAGTTGPGLIGWFYPDEADARGLAGESLVPGGPGLRFLTLTAHFFSGAAPLPGGRGMYPGLIAKTDVVGFDLYPLQELCRPELLPSVFDAQQELRRLAAPRATFQWIEARELKCPQPEAAVTPATIRVESWLAIAGGATGLGVFPPNLEPWAAGALRGVTARIRQLAPALLTPPLPVAADAPDVRASARELGGALYVIAVNAGTAPAAVHLSAPELGGRSFLGGEAAANGRLAVTLPARSARVYASPP